jgi:hypothetical protein
MNTKTAIRNAELTQQFSQNEFDGALAKVLADLQRALAEVEKVAAEYAQGETTPDDAAERIAHKIMWTIPNLHLDTMQRAAGNLASLRHQLEVLKALEG